VRSSRCSLDKEGCSFLKKRTKKLLLLWCHRSAPVGQSTRLPLALRRRQSDLARARTPERSRGFLGFASEPLRSRDARRRHTTAPMDKSLFASFSSEKEVLPLQ
jgi:hypothetical protein